MLALGPSERCGFWRKMPVVIGFLGWKNILLPWFWGIFARAERRVYGVLGVSRAAHADVCARRKVGFCGVFG
jgi:hypothetical protein